MTSPPVAVAESRPKFSPWIDMDQATKAHLMLLTDPIHWEGCPMKRSNLYFRLSLVWLGILVGLFALLWWFR